MAGYSGTPLPQKLGIKDGARVRLDGAPAGFARGLGVVARARGEADVIVPSRAGARAAGGALPRRCASRCTRRAGCGSRGRRRRRGSRPTSTKTVREHGLAPGLVDNKVCAIDEMWSGLRFVVRVGERWSAPPAPTRGAGGRGGGGWGATRGARRGNQKRSKQ